MVKHFSDSVGLYIHTTFDILAHPDIKEFETKLKAVRGIEKYTISRYNVSIAYGYLFTWSEVIEEALKLFENTFGYSAREEITVEDILKKINQHFINTPIGSSMPTIDFSKLGKMADA